MRRITPCCFGYVLSILLGLLSPPAISQTSPSNDPPFYGPYSGVFLTGGDGLEKKLGEHDSLLRAESPWSMYCWVRLDEDIPGPTPVAGIGDPNEEYARYIGLSPGKATLSVGKENGLEGSAKLDADKWHLLAATFDGKDFHLFVDGQPVSSGKLAIGSVGPLLSIAPPISPGLNNLHFGGRVAKLTLLRDALSADAIKQLWQAPQDFSLLEFE